MVQKQGMRPDQSEDENIATAKLETVKQLEGIPLASESQDVFEGKYK